MKRLTKIKFLAMTLAFSMTLSSLSVVAEEIESPNNIIEPSTEPSEEEGDVDNINDIDDIDDTDTADELDNNANGESGEAQETPKAPTGRVFNDSVLDSLLTNEAILEELEKSEDELVITGSDYNNSIVLEGNLTINRDVVIKDISLSENNASILDIGSHTLTIAEGKTLTIQNTETTGSNSSIIRSRNGKLILEERASAIVTENAPNATAIWSPDIIMKSASTLDTSNNRGIGISGNIEAKSAEIIVSGNDSHGFTGSLNLSGTTITAEENGYNGINIKETMSLKEDSTISASGNNKNNETFGTDLAFIIGDTVESIINDSKIDTGSIGNYQGADGTVKVQTANGGSITVNEEEIILTDGITYNFDAGKIVFSESSVNNPAAKVNNIGYATLKEAINAAAEMDGQPTVALLKDDNASITIPAGADIILDGNNYTLTGRITFESEVTDNNKDTIKLVLNNVKMKSANAYTIAIHSDAGRKEKPIKLDLTLNNCAIEDYTGKGIYVTNITRMEINDSVFDNNSGGIDTGKAGDYSVDVNLINTHCTEIIITNTQFNGVLNDESKSALKIAQRGTINTDSTKDDKEVIEFGDGSQIDKVIIKDCTFNITGTKADIFLGASGYTDDEDKAKLNTSNFPVEIDNTDGSDNISVCVRNSINLEKNIGYGIIDIPAGTTGTKEKTDSDTDFAPVFSIDNNGSVTTVNALPKLNVVDEDTFRTVLASAVDGSVIKIVNPITLTENTAINKNVIIEGYEEVTDSELKTTMITLAGGNLTINAGNVIITGNTARHILAGKGRAGSALVLEKGAVLTIEGNYTNSIMYNTPINLDNAALTITDNRGLGINSGFVFANNESVINIIKSKEGHGFNGYITLNGKSVMNISDNDYAGINAYGINVDGNSTINSTGNGKGKYSGSSIIADIVLMAKGDGSLEETGINIVDGSMTANSLSAYRGINENKKITIGSNGKLVIGSNTYTDSISDVSPIEITVNLNEGESINIVNALGKSESITDISTITVTYGYKLPIPSRKGYSFVNWTLNGNAVTHVTETGTYKANWKEIINPVDPVDPEKPSASGRSSGGGSSVSVSTKPAVSMNDTSMGTVTISKDNKTVTITPKDGYIIADVIINGSSVGAVSSYTFDTVSTKHKIEVIFEKETASNTSIPAEYYKEPENKSNTPFSDVTYSDWYFEAVKYAYTKGIFSGTSDTTFGPSDHMTRAMFATVIHRLAGTPAASDFGAFTDIPSDTWFASGVAWSYEKGIVNGVGDGLFAPNNNITREQMAVILYNYAQAAGYDVLDTGTLENFADGADVSPWAVNAVQWATANGLLTGKGSNDLDPSGSATRAEVASILMRFSQKY